MQRNAPTPQTQNPPASEQAEVKRTTVTVRLLRLPEAVTVSVFAQMMKVSAIDVMKQLMRAGVMANINQAIDFPTAAAIAPHYGFRAVPLEDKAKESRGVEEEQEAPALLKPRPPVVTILGHVDHGKTTLLDTIRKTRVAAREAGGITQHIGAYQAEYNGQIITFLDTPGHEAFTAMRARGAEVTDIAVLVVAANDGIMPQTVEAMNHAKAAKVPIVVAINKVDLPDADVERVKRQLSENGLLIEEWGGDIIAVAVSAKSGVGVDDLLQNILVVAEVAELKANPDRAARGVVVEARLDKSRGPVATVLVQTGTLKVGDNFVAGSIAGRVKALVDYRGRRIRAATPSMPIEVLGLGELPRAGDVFLVAASEKEARSLAEKRLARQGVSLEDMLSRIRTGEAKELNLILKADVQGSIEAIREALTGLSTDKTQVRIVHTASGSITESDVFLAAASQAIILGFNISVEPGARHAADAEHVEIRSYNVIYHLLEDVKNTIEGMVAPVTKDVVEGHAVIRAVFERGRAGKAAGIYVTDGRVLRNGSARVVRGGQVVHDGPISSLRRFKEDVREMATGYECGIALTGFDDYQEGDVIEVHRQDQVPA